MTKLPNRWETSLDKDNKATPDIRISQNGTIISLYLEAKIISLDGKVVPLITPLEFHILQELITHCGETISKEQLQDSWGYKRGWNMNAVVRKLQEKVPKIRISNLRGKWYYILWERLSLEVLHPIKKERDTTLDTVIQILSEKPEWIIYTELMNLLCVSERWLALKIVELNRKLRGASQVITRNLGDKSDFYVLGHIPVNKVSGT